jgi:DHA1 family tetracycline resistance protein-like MFS transporter
MKSQPLLKVTGELAVTGKLQPPKVVLSWQTRRILFLLAACIALMMTGYGIVLPVFAKRIGELGSGVQALGLMTMGFAFAQFILSPFMGSFADRYGRRPLILMALAGEVLANLTYIYAQSIPLYIGVRFFQGAITAGLLPAALAIVGDRVPEDRHAQWTGVIMASYGAGFILGPALGGLLFDRWGYAAPFAVTGTLALIGLILAVVMIPETRPANLSNKTLKVDRDQMKWKNILAALPKPITLFVTLLIIDFIATFAFAFIEPQMALYAYNQLFLSPAQLGIIVGVYGLAMLLGQGFLGTLSDRLGRKPVMLVGLLLNATLYVGLIFVKSFGLLCLIALIAGMGDALFIPAIGAAYLDIAEPAHRSLVMGIKGSGAALAGVVGPLLVAIISAWAAPQSIFAISALATFVAILVTLFFLKSRFLVAKKIESESERVQPIIS